jgi:DMSO/TMAO reductase YedYZ molybdopterin-dependent catalytic subunit
MNGEPLSIGRGAPLRLRVERQLGYKQAKYETRLKAVATKVELPLPLPRSDGQKNP